MREIGGYLELDLHRLPMRHERAIALNSGRNCLAYLIKTRNIKNISLPKFLCDSVAGICKKYEVEVKYYSTGLDFIPIEESIDKVDDNWLYVVNYYGQISNEILKSLRSKYGKLIVDNIQAYFQEPCEEIDTIYSCRKFFGVADGAFLYSEVLIDEKLKEDYSCERVTHLLGRFERTASEYYPAYIEAEEEFEQMPLRRMSKLTNNFLHGIDYEYVERKRTENYAFIHENLSDINKLKLTIPVGPYMYPFYIQNGAIIREKLQKEKIYIPILWPEVLNTCGKNELEYDMANNILPLPVDQRYNLDDMRYMIKELIKCTG